MCFASLTNILHFLIALFFPIRDHYVEYVSSKVRNSVLYVLLLICLYQTVIDRTLGNIQVLEQFHQNKKCINFLVHINSDNYTMYFTALSIIPLKNYFQFFFSSDSSQNRSLCNLLEREYIFLIFLKIEHSIGQLGIIFLTNLKVSRNFWSK